MTKKDNLSNDRRRKTTKGNRFSTNKKNSQNEGKNDQQYVAFSHPRIPIITKDTISKITNGSLKGFNLGLFLNKYYNVTINTKNNEVEDKDEKKSAFLTTIINGYKDHHAEYITSKINSNVSKLFSHFIKNGYFVPSNQASKPFLMQLEWRMIHGLGQTSILERSMTIHHTYGIPYIPSSSIKGIMRSFALIDLIEGYQKQIEEKLFSFMITIIEESWFEKITDIEELKKKYSTHLHNIDDNSVKDFIQFLNNNIDLVHRIQLTYGYKDFSGLLLILDSYPHKQFVLELDIMNVHYKKYYTEEKVLKAYDWEDPQPLVFLTVGNNTKFEFYLLIDKVRFELNNEKTKKLFETPSNMYSYSKNHLIQGLSKLGIGSKTRSGYGYFRVVNN